MTLMQLFLIHRYKAVSVHYVTPTEDNQRQTQKMQRLGIFSDVNTEVGQIIVADVNREGVLELLKPDRAGLAAAHPEDGVGADRVGRASRTGDGSRLVPTGRDVSLVFLPPRAGLWHHWSPCSRGLLVYRSAPCLALAVHVRVGRRLGRGRGRAQATPGAPVAAPVAGRVAPRWPDRHRRSPRRGRLALGGARDRLPPARSRRRARPPPSERRCACCSTTRRSTSAPACSTASRAAITRRLTRRDQNSDGLADAINVYLRSASRPPDGRRVLSDGGRHAERRGVVQRLRVGRHVGCRVGVGRRRRRGRVDRRTADPVLATPLRGRRAT